MDSPPAVLRGLESATVDLSRLRRIDAPTGVAPIHVEAKGENSITVVPGANARRRCQHGLSDDLLARARPSSCSSRCRCRRSPALAARAHASGARVILDAAPSRALPPELLSALDVLIVNEVEAAAIAAALAVPPRPKTFAGAMHRNFGCATVVTVGVEGALAVADGMLHPRGSARRAASFDTTGAGDAFAGALAAALDREKGWPRALAEGVAAGSLACTAVGAQAALPDAAAIAPLADTVESGLVSQHIE